MKIFVSLLLLFCCEESNGQADFRKQFKSLMNNFEMNLANYKGDFVEMVGSDSLYQSRITLEGTTKNEITISNTKFHFMAKVTDSINERQGRKVVEEWKSKLSFIIKEGYNVNQLDIKKWNHGVYGWRFTRNGYTVSITLFSGKHEKTYFVILGIDNFDFID